MKNVLGFLVLTVVFGGFACANKTQPQTAAKGDTASSKSGSASKSAKSSPQSESPPVTKGDVTIVKSSSCRLVEKLGPVDEAETFPSNVGRVYLYNQIKLETSAETSIQHIWSYKDKKLAKVTLPVRGPQWRTYSSKVIDPSFKGEWKVDITTASGELIKSHTFRIE